MQLLMTASARDRVSGRLAAFAPDLVVVTVETGGVFRREGQVIEAGEVDPELFWISLDSYANGVMGDLVGVLLKGSRGRWVQVFSAGIDNPVFGRIMEKGLRLTKSNAQAPAIAEYVVSHALSLLHPIDAARAAQAEGAWRRIPFREIGQSRWLLIGYGAIGREIARRMRAFGAAITVVRRSAGEEAGVDEVATQADLPRLLPEADVVVLACALNDDTRDLADEAFFQAMKPDSILINIGRGQLVDEDALRHALDRDAPRAAVLDVFRTEPLPADAWPWTHPKVRVTAHASNAGDGLLGRGDDQFLENLRRFLAGQPLVQEASPVEVGL